MSGMAQKNASSQRALSLSVGKRGRNSPAAKASRPHLPGETQIRELANEADSTEIARSFVSLRFGIVSMSPRPRGPAIRTFDPRQPKCRRTARLTHSHSSAVLATLGVPFAEALLGSVALSPCRPSGSPVAGEPRVRVWLLRRCGPPDGDERTGARPLRSCLGARLALHKRPMALPQEFHQGFENLMDIVGKGDNMPIAGLIPIIMFFTWLAMREAFRHDRLIAQGREEEILDEMYK